MMDTPMGFFSLSRSLVLLFSPASQQDVLARSLKTLNLEGSSRAPAHQRTCGKSKKEITNKLNKQSKKKYNARARPASRGDRGMSLGGG